MSGHTNEDVIHLCSEASFTSIFNAKSVSAVPYFIIENRNVIEQFCSEASFTSLFNTKSVSAVPYFIIEN